MTGLNPHPQLVDGVDVDAIAAAVRACPGVEDLAAGLVGSVASYLPGRTVPGIAVAGDHVTIQVRGRWAVPASQVGTQVRSAVGGLVGPRRVDIVIADIADPSGTDPSMAATVTAPPAPRPGALAQGQAGEAGHWSQPGSGQHAAPIIPPPTVTPPSS
jgi:hypothetical protein